MTGKIVFEFQQGSFYSGTVRYTITWYNGSYYFEGSFSNSFADMPPVGFGISYEEIEELLAVIKPACRWRRKYSPVDEIDDGFGYKLKSRFKTCSISSEGYESFPQDYSIIIRSFQEKIEDLRLEKNPEIYDYNGRKARIELGCQV